MMKNLLLLLCLTGLCLSSRAQTNLVLNDENKLMYHKVTNLLTTDTTQQALNAAGFLKKQYPELKISQANIKGGRVTGAGKMLVYRKGLLAGQEEGQFTYTLTLDFKPDRYRLIVTNLLYKPLKRTRYGTFSAAEGVETPAEKLEGKLSDNTYKNYTNQLYSYSAYLSQQLNDYLISPEGKKGTPATREKVSTKNW
jgi:hypothetical protein